MPPPEPRSSTVSPGLSSASAVGLPQPSDAFRASVGDFALLRRVVQVRRDRIAAPVDAAAPPQHELRRAGSLARSAAWPYFSLTTSFTLSGAP